MNISEDLPANPERFSQLVKDSEDLMGRGEPNTYCSISLRLCLGRYVILFEKVFP
jgi:hypothetical protein